MSRFSEAAGRASGSQSFSHGPTYQPPKHALTPQAVHKLRNLSQSKELNELRDLHKAAIEAISECTAGLEKLRHRKQERKQRERSRLQKSKTARRSVTVAGSGDERNSDAEQDDEGMDEDEDTFDAQAEAKSRIADTSVRKLVDGLQELHDQGDILRDLLRVAEAERGEYESGARGSQSAATQRLQRLARGDAADSQMSRMSSVTAPGDTQDHFTPEQREYQQLLPTFGQKNQEAKDRWQSLSKYARYAENNDYVGFKENMHFASNADDEVPVPHKNTWFDDGPARGASPAPGMSAVDDEDDDIQTIRVKISTKCPLTLQEMENPVSNRKCNHVFEKAAVEQYIRQHKFAAQQNRRRGQIIGNPDCPCQGCTEHIGLGDLFVDPAVVRRIKRIQEARKREDAMDESDDEHVRSRSKSRTVGHDGWEEVDADDD
jgi:E3 SUMO-protein ligase NSE2